MSINVHIVQMPALVTLPKLELLGVIYINAESKLVNWARQERSDSNKFTAMGAIANGAVSSGQVAATGATFKGLLYVFYQGSDRGLCWATARK